MDTIATNFKPEQQYTTYEQNVLLKAFLFKPDDELHCDPCELAFSNPTDTIRLIKESDGQWSVSVKNRVSGHYRYLSETVGRFGELENAIAAALEMRGRLNLAAEIAGRV
jgi:hypothetical protein